MVVQFPANSVKNTAQSDCHTTDPISLIVNEDYNKKVKSKGHFFRFLASLTICPFAAINGIKCAGGVQKFQRDRESVFVQLPSHFAHRQQQFFKKLLPQLLVGI